MKNPDLTPSIPHNGNPVRKKTNPSDEIDLLELFSYVKKGLKRVVFTCLTALARFRRTVLSNKKILATAFLIGLIGGALYCSLLRRDVYLYSIEISSKFLDPEIVQSSVDNFNRLSSSDDYSTELGAMLHIDSAAASSIHRFECEKFISEFELDVSEKLKTIVNDGVEKLSEKDNFNFLLSRAALSDVRSFSVKIETSMPIQAAKLQSGLVNYFHEHDFIKKRLMADLELKLKRRDKLIAESVTLDSLRGIVLLKIRKDIQNRNRQGSNNVILSDKENTNPLELLGRQTSIFDEIQRIDFDILVKSDFEVLNNMSVVKKEKMSNVLFSLVSALGFSIFALGTIMVRKFDQFLDKIA